MTTRHRTAAQNADYSALPLRNDYGIKLKAFEIEQARTKTEKDELRKESGINGQSAFSAVDSLDFPWSFPLDMMHVLFENIMPQLMLCWRGKYKNDKDDKGKDVTDRRTFVLSDTAWEEIKLEVAASNTMVPSQFALYVNSIDKKSYWTAETHSYFLMHLWPIIMKDRLPTPYYRHFVELSEITKVLVKIEMTQSEVDSLPAQLVKWVKDLEKVYYAWDMKYISSCTAPIHSLLHVAECVKRQSPLAMYWCFAMERYGGMVKRYAKNNRKQVITAITNRIIKEERIHQLATLFSAEDDTSAKWWDTLRGKSPAYIASYSSRPAQEADYMPGALLDAMTPQPYLLDPEVIKAIATLLSTRAYTDRDWQSGRSAVVDETYVQQICFTAWRAYRSDSDTGDQKYRIGRENGGGQATFRDASWATYIQYEDKDRHTNRPVARWVQVQKWGQIKLFLTFTWNNEDLSVAVVRAYQTTDWIAGIASPPQLLGRIDGSLLQVIGLDALDAVAGRVTVLRNGHKKTIIFETSGGALKAPAVEEVPSGG
ncbi:hypothetical protein QFC24_001300 [Naganishia onofrii]|uniref:Uncharacterized protein n=1 Tax=Naganishia onofrii TaxID=1851511 RepID=A0ACC2XUL8_9TREE|nr:hypothetical protein QFC24_001300 [Naganishia onofrii]